MIFEVTEELAFSQSLEQTSRDVEYAIVMATKELLVRESREPEEPHHKIKGVRAIQEALGVEFLQIERILSDKNRPVQRIQATVTNRDHVIFRVTEARVFSQSLKKTVEDVERAIILVACIRYGCNMTAVRDALGTGWQRIQRHFPGVEKELKLSGWPLPRRNNSDARSSAS